MKFITPYNISLIILLDQCFGNENEYIMNEKLFKFVLKKLRVNLMIKSDLFLRVRVVVKIHAVLAN